MLQRSSIALYAACGGVAVMMPTLLLGAQATLMRRDVALPEAVLGLIIGGFFAASALAAYPAGWALRRFGTSVVRAAFVVSGGALAVAGIWAESGWQIGALIAFAGIANPTAQIGLNQLVASEVEARHQGGIYGIKQASVPLAAVIAGISVPTLGAAFGWRSAFVAAGIAALLLSLFRVPRLRREREVHKLPQNVMATGKLGLLIVAGGFAAMTITSSGGFIAISGVAAGIPAPASGALLAAGSALGVTGRIGLGLLADRTTASAFRMSSAALCLGAAGLAILAFGTAAPALFVVGAMVAFAGTWSWPGLLWLGVARVWRDRSAGPMASVAIGQYAGGIIGPLLFGLAVGIGGYAVAWGALGACAGLAALAFFLAGAATTHSGAATSSTTGGASVGGRR
jgi:hypothetical protein